MEQLKCVGIGASAGGLEALQRFFAHINPDVGLAFVVVLHLAPEHKSLMPELLARRTRLHVRQAEDLETLKANHVYLIPPGKVLELDASGNLRVLNRTQELPPHPINHFFKSLAREFGKRAVGIVFSGTGSDGSDGLQHLQRVGALTLAQSPNTAQFDSMPTHAVATGALDWVASPEALAESINTGLAPVKDDSIDALGTTVGDEFSIIAPRIGDDDALIHTKQDAQAMGALMELLEQTTGVAMARYKPATVARRVRRRLQATQQPDLISYLTYARGNTNELRELKRELSVVVTAFFRNPDVFDYMQKNVFPQLGSIDGGVRIWIAGCATGEEAYSIAMLCVENFGDTTRDLRIFATDLDSHSLAIASRGR